jgi:hypothetical protein
VASRFELYYHGVELANGYHELLDADEQRARFAADLRERETLGLPPIPPDQQFLAALECGLPDCSGVALGLDRLIMLAVGSRYAARGDGVSGVAPVGCDGSGTGRQEVVLICRGRRSPRRWRSQSEGRVNREPLPCELARAVIVFDPHGRLCQRLERKRPARSPGGAFSLAAALTPTPSPYPPPR